MRQGSPALVPVLVALSLSLAGCGDEPPQPNNGPGFDLFGFFDGHARSAGRVDPLFGATERFSARFEGDVKGDRLRLLEVFTFPDGQFDQIWALRRDGDALSGTVRTEGKDGELSDPAAVRGWLDPQGAVLRYQGYAPGGGDLRLDFTHRMSAQPDGTLLNEVTVGKFHLPLAWSEVRFMQGER